MNNSTGKLIATATLFLALGAICALIISGEWMIPLCAITGWAVGLRLIRSLG